MAQPTTTVQIYREDRSRLDLVAGTPAKAVRRLLCDHPLESRMALGRTEVVYSDGRRVPVTVFQCNFCNWLIVLPGMVRENED